MGRKFISIHGVNGSRVATATVSSGAGLFTSVAMLVLFAYIGLAVAIAVLAFLLVVLVVRLCQAAPPVPKQYDRVDDAAVRAHRARMAAIRDGRTAARFEGQARISNRR